MATPGGSYASVIRISRAYRQGFDVRHIEAWMRENRGTLDGLSWTEFDHAVSDAIANIQYGGVQMAEDLAQCLGL